MARTVPGVLASFEHLDAACSAIASLRAQGRKDFTVYTAAPSHELEHALGITDSPVSAFTLVGGLTGVCAGIGMTYWMSLDWPLLVGGKPIASVPPYVVFMFELMVLIGSLSTVAGVIILSLARPTTGMAYDPRYSDDQIGIFVPCPPADAPGLVRMFRDAGSVEVRHAA